VGPYGPEGRKLRLKTDVSMGAVLGRDN